MLTTEDAARTLLLTATAAGGLRRGDGWVFGRAAAAVDRAVADQILASGTDSDNSDVGLLVEAVAGQGPPDGDGRRNDNGSREDNLWAMRWTARPPPC